MEDRRNWDVRKFFPMIDLERKEALYCSKVIGDYFEKFNSVDEYMLDQKLEQLKDMPTALPGMGFEEDLFNDLSMAPEDMQIGIVNIDDKTFNSCLNIISSHTNMVSVPGKNLKLGVKEKNTDKWLGFIRLASPVINMKPRNELLGQVPELSIFNKTTIMGFVIVPTQPFGFNCLGGKLLAALCCSHEVREKLNKKYDMNLVYFETTSLYGSSKSLSQYDGMKPILKNRGLSNSDFTPLMHGEPWTRLVNYVESRVGNLVPKDASSKKLKLATAIQSLIKRSLDGIDLENFKNILEDAKKLTERKRYYVSNYGIKNYIDVVNGKTNENIKDDNYDKYKQENLIKWWKKKATKRYNSLKSDNRLRNELEVWTNSTNIDIIR